MWVEVVAIEQAGERAGGGPNENHRDDEQQHGPGPSGPREPTSPLCSHRDILGPRVCARPGPRERAPTEHQPTGWQSLALVLASTDHGGLGGPRTAGTSRDRPGGFISRSWLGLAFEGLGGALPRA